MKIRTNHQPPARVVWGIAASPVGKLAVGLTEKGEVCRISFLQKREAAEVLAEWRTEWPQTKFSVCESDNPYYVEKMKCAAEINNLADQPVLLIGTPFQLAVWRMIAKIPPGHVRTYGDIAQRLGKTGAARAVGAACGANPVPFLIPCHRVVARSGLGGFSGGLEIKKALLKAEGR